MYITLSLGPLLVGIECIKNILAEIPSRSLEIVLPRHYILHFNITLVSMKGLAFFFFKKQDPNHLF